MKTTSQKKSNRLPQESKLSAQAAEQPTSTPQPERVDTRLPIDTEARKQNRTLPTEKVLALLQQQDRRLWEMAEVVGKWIWVSFSEQPAPTVRQTLAQLGFHWNRTRQSWQHPWPAASAWAQPPVAGRQDRISRDLAFCQPARLPVRGSAAATGSRPDVLFSSDATLRASEEKGERLQGETERGHFMPVNTG